MTLENQTVFLPEGAKFQGKAKTKRQTGEGSLHPSAIPFFDRRVVYDIPRISVDVH